MQAVAVAAAARSDPAIPLDPDRFVAQVSAHAQTRQLRTAVQRVSVLVRRGATPVQVATELGNDVRALASVPAALAAFLTHPDDPAAATRFAICTGGDTDTIAAMTGALCGARHGDHDLPAAWTSRLEAAGRITDLARALAELPHAPDQPGDHRPDTLAGSGANPGGQDGDQEADAEACADPASAGSPCCPRGGSSPRSAAARSGWARWLRPCSPSNSQSSHRH